MIKKKSELPKNELSARNFARLQRIFTQKHWPINDEFDSSVFDNFCNLLDGLDKSQQELMLVLTENFLWVNEIEYIKRFSLSFDSFINCYPFNGKEEIVITPLLAKNDFGRNKSSTTLFYLIKSRLHSLQAKYPNFKITLEDRPERVKCSHKMDTTILCLVDDFVGSGETAICAVEYFLNNRFPKTQIAVVALVAMQSGFQMLSKAGYNIYVDSVQKKGITGSGRDEASETKTMQEIENSIKVPEDYRFGYSQSEALVKMIRTPNNTFPIYWYATKENQYAPFPRF